MVILSTGVKFTKLNQDHPLKKIGFSGQIRIKIEL